MINKVKIQFEPGSVFFLVQCDAHSNGRLKYGSDQTHNLIGRDRESCIIELGSKVGAVDYFSFSAIKTLRAKSPTTFKINSNLKTIKDVLIGRGRESCIIELS